MKEKGYDEREVESGRSRNPEEVIELFRTSVFSRLPVDLSGFEVFFLKILGRKIGKFGTYFR